MVANVNGWTDKAEIVTECSAHARLSSRSRWRPFHRFGLSSNCEVLIWVTMYWTFSENFSSIRQAVQEEFVEKEEEETGMQ